MSGILLKLQALLDAEGVDYAIIHHRADYRARTTAVDTHTPVAEFAKTVLVEVDGRYAMAVLPADHSVSTSRLAKSLDAAEVRIATERELDALCPDAEVGAAPPFGVLYDLPVYVCPLITRDEHLTFNAGSHTDAVRMIYRDYARIAKPRVVHMSKHEGDPVPAAPSSTGAESRGKTRSSSPIEEGHLMSDLNDLIEKELDSLRQARDELRVQVHLAKAEAKDLWEDLEKKFQEAEGRAKVIAKESEGSLEHIGEAAKGLLREIGDGYKRIRDLL